MNFCEYGCGQEGKYYLEFKHVPNKWCCSKKPVSCPKVRYLKSESSKGRVVWNKGKSYTYIELYGEEKTKVIIERTKGKKYNEIYGEKRSDQIRKKQSSSMLGKNKRTWEETHGKEKAKKLRIQKSKERIGRTYKEIYGEEKSEIIVKKISKSNIKRNEGISWVELYGEDKSRKIKKKLRKSQKLTIFKIKKRYPFFSQVEEIRYNPDKPGEKEIQVHCKYSECENSKEKDGWFTPTYNQLHERIRQLENPQGNDGGHLYCSDNCKSICPLYYSRGNDPYKETETSYIPGYEIFREEVLKRQKETEGYNFCEYCDSRETLHVHHEKPQKTNPLFVLDPDNGLVLCKDCHYIIGHQDECSTGNLASKVC